MKITSITVDVGILSWVWIEEAYELEDVSAFDTLIESIRGSYPSEEFFKQITLTFNPWHENHFLKREFFYKETKSRDKLALTTNFIINVYIDVDDIKQ